MKSWEMAKSIRKAWGRNPAGQVIRTAKDRARRRQALKRALKGELARGDDDGR